MYTSDLDPRDYKYIVQDTTGFSPERNKAIIAKTLADYEKFAKGIQVEQDQGMMERLDVMASYASHRFGQGEKKLREFLGERYYRELVGEKLLERIRIAQTVDTLRGKGKMGGYILT